MKVSFQPLEGPQTKREMWGKMGYLKILVAMHESGDEPVDYEKVARCQREIIQLYEKLRPAPSSKDSFDA